MRIAYDHQIFDMQQYGGVSRYFVELAKGVSNTPDMSVRVVSPLYINSYLAAAPHSLDIVGRHVPPVRFTGHVRRRVNRMLAPSLLAGFHPDLVHETHYAIDRVAPAVSKTVVSAVG